MGSGKFLWFHGFIKRREKRVSWWLGLEGKNSGIDWGHGKDELMMGIVLHQERGLKQKNKLNLAFFLEDCLNSEACSFSDWEMFKWEPVAPQWDQPVSWATRLVKTQRFKQRVNNTQRFRQGVKTVAARGKKKEPEGKCLLDGWGEGSWSWSRCRSHRLNRQTRKSVHLLRSEH